MAAPTHRRRPAQKPLPTESRPHMGWIAAAAGVAGVLFGARQAGRNRVENMRRTVEVQRDQLKAASRRPRDRGELPRRMRDGAPCPPVSSTAGSSWCAPPANSTIFPPARPSSRCSWTTK